MSTLKVNTLTDTAATKSVPIADVVNGTARAWVNFNGTAATSPFTVANGGIRAAYNVASVTDNGTGNYTVNFTNAMTDANYTLVGTASRTAAQSLPRVVFFIETDTYSTTAVQIRVAETSAGGAFDCGIINLTIFR